MRLFTMHVQLKVLSIEMQLHVLVKLPSLDKYTIENLWLFEKEKLQGCFGQFEN